MAQILTQRSVTLAKIEVTFGDDPTPTPADDAILVNEPDFTPDIAVIERAFARNTLSPLPVASGRKLAGMTFQHEVRGNGSTSTAPKLGVLLRGCGFGESQIVVNGAATGGRADATADSGNGGPSTTWAAGGTMAQLRDSEYRVRVVLGGSSGTAEVRVTGGYKPEDELTHASQDEDAVPTEYFAYTTDSVAGTITVDESDPKAVEFAFGGTWVEAESITVWVMGLPFTFAAPATPTPTTVGDAMETAVDAHADISATNTIGDVVCTFSNNLAEVVITTTTTAVPLGASGLTITPTWSGVQVVDDFWLVVVKPVGFEYNPISDSIDSVTLYMYFDGILHKMTGARGTFTVEATGGEIGQFNFTFTGNFETVTDVAMPATPTYESQIPVQIELAELVVNDDSFVTGASAVNNINGEVDSLGAAGFTIDLANEINPRECINEADSFLGVVLTGRAPSGTMSPEVELEATHPFWANLENATKLAWRVKVGDTAGNVVRFKADSCQYAGNGYADRNGLRVYEIDLRFSAVTDAGDDELLIIFC